MNNIELLAPAGTPEALVAAFSAGADAVYAGLPRFNARERGENFTVENMRQGMECLRQMGQLLGTDHLIYRAAVEGVNQKLNVDVEEAFSSDWIFECFVAEAVIQSLMAGAYVDITDVKNGFKYEHFRDIVCDYAKKYGIV